MDELENQAEDKETTDKLHEEFQKKCLRKEEWLKPPVNALKGLPLRLYSVKLG